MRTRRYNCFGIAFLKGIDERLKGLSGLLLFSPAAKSRSVETAQNEIRATLENWTKDFNTGNSAGVCALFARDRISNYQGQPDRDYHALCPRLLAVLNDPVKSYRCTLMLKEVIVCGELAVIRVKWLLKVARKGAPEERLTKETRLDIFRRQADGRWKIFRFIAYPHDLK